MSGDAQISRPASFTEEEVQIKPPIDLIPDEYQRCSNENFSVQIFYANTEDNLNNCRTFVDALGSVGFKIDENQDIHDIQKINYLAIIEKIRNRCEGKDGLIFLYTGFYKTENNLLFYEGKEDKQVTAKDIWTRFTSKNCPCLKNKPKLFLFQATKYGITEQMDGERRISRKYTYESAYGAPAEADILIVYNKTDGIAVGGDPQEFLSQVCDNIKMYGKSEDVLSLITCTECIYHATRPLLISTLTRKFFFTINQVRGHHLYINEQQDEVAKHLRELHDTLTSNKTDVDKDKEKKRIFSFNFGKSGDKVKKREEKNKYQNEEIDGRTDPIEKNGNLNKNEHQLGGLKNYNTDHTGTIQNHGTTGTKFSTHAMSHLHEHQEARTNHSTTTHKHSTTSGISASHNTQSTTSSTSSSHNTHQQHVSQTTVSETKGITILTSSSRKASTSSVGSKYGSRNLSGSECESARSSLRTEQDKERPPWR